jgi:hypothetical protein
MGMPWPTPLIQITATSEEQTDNIYAALRPMIDKGPLSEVIRKTGEEFIRLPGGGRIDTVTSNARSRLGAARHLRAAGRDRPLGAVDGMVKRREDAATRPRRHGRPLLGDHERLGPSENSVAQQTYEARAADIFKDFPQAPSTLSFRNKAERRRILRAVYAGSPWVDLDAIEAEAAELLETDPQKAERFFGNRLVYASGSWLPDGRWDDSENADRVVEDGAYVCGGFDGSENNDFTAIRLETADGFSFTPTYGPDRRPTVWNPAEWGGQIDRATRSHAAVDEIATRYNLGRFYCDPQDWRSEIGAWALQYGDKVFVEWATNRPSAMYDALVRARSTSRPAA